MRFGDLDVRRRGRRTDEWLLERQYVMDVNGHVAVVFRDPRRMVQNTAWVEWHAQKELWPLARMLGNEDIVISFGVWDRAVQNAMSRHQRQYHEACLVHLESKMGPEEVLLIRLMSWCLAVGAVRHRLAAGR